MWNSSMMCLKDRLDAGVGNGWVPGGREKIRWKDGLVPFLYNI